MKTLFIFNDAPYGNERCYNGLRLAASVAKLEGQSVKIFLIGDASASAKSGQKLPQGYYNIEVMIRNVLRQNGEVGVCGTCIDARGITAAELMEGAKRSTMDELTAWTIWADKVLVF
jgi:uncharacterized protein involved in oxidation of intracellular sulfur